MSAGLFWNPIPAIDSMLPAISQVANVMLSVIIVIVIVGTVIIINTETMSILLIMDVGKKDTYMMQPKLSI